MGPFTGVDGEPQVAEHPDRTEIYFDHTVIKLGIHCTSGDSDRTGFDSITNMGNKGMSAPWDITDHQAL